MTETAPRRALALGLIFVGAATLIGNGAAYALSMVAARVLVPAEFGAFMDKEQASWRKIVEAAKLSME